jgi:hypothetical protein
MATISRSKAIACMDRRWALNKASANLAEGFTITLLGFGNDTDTDRLQQAEKSFELNGSLHTNTIQTGITA